MQNNLLNNYQPSTDSYNIFNSDAFSLFELLISLALVSLILLFLMISGIQAAKMYREFEEEKEFLTEGKTLLQMICQDLRSASNCSEKLTLNTSLPFSKKNIFFLKRTSSDDLIAVGYFLDSNKKDHCYRFCTKPNETLAAIIKGSLAELQAKASPIEPHSQLVAKHLLLWEVLPIWNKEKKIILLEINMAFGKTKPCYFLSTVVGLPPS